MRALEWSAVLKQVACFCRTSAAAEQVAGGTLPRGGGPGECELLLQQTHEAREAGLSLDGCFDIRPAIEAAASGVLLSAKQLEGVASTLESAFAIKLQACAAAGQQQQQQQGAGGLRYPALATIARGISDEERTLLRAIRGCIKHGNVTNEASEALAAVRAERQANKEALRAAVDGWARALVAKGAAEPGAVSIVRNRFCVGVRAGRQGELPKGSVRLGASSTGATLYIEPAPCVPLNNAEVLLAEREEQEVARVLGLLSSLMGSRAEQLHALVGAVTALDVVAARAGHSAWIGGVRPQVTDPDAGTGTGAASSSSSSGGGGSQGSSCLFIPGARHPVLMQRGLPPLPQPPSIDDNRFDRDFQAAPAWELRRVLTPEGPRPGEGPQAADAHGGDEGGGGGDDAASLLPRPLDLRVPSGKAVVAITGPNTGGKTVTIKAAGLLALMAQHGLFLPCDEAQVASHGPPRVAWFDRVLADIGDNQSLQQSLSTFSGHVRRIKQILSTATPRSLVLLDEVGSGTDPLEGAALARAVLDRLAGQSRLTLATTHHAELKRVADEDARYVTVSMAFDTASLRPTYALLWGAAGASNALDIAETLGFDRSVVLEARQVARTLAVDGRGAVGSASGGLAAAAAGAGGAVLGDGGRESHLAGVARSLVLQLEDTREELQAAKDLRARREQAVATLQDTLQQLRQFESELRSAPQDIVAERDRLAAEAQEALVAFSAGLQAQDRVEAALRQIEQLIPDEIAQYRGHARRSAAGNDDDGEYDDLYDDFKPGDDVYIKSYGDVGAAKVVSVKGDMVTVRFTAFGGLMGNARVKQRSKAFHRREVQRVTKGSENLFGSIPQWRVAGYDAMLADIRRVIGETTEAERAAAAEAAARRSQQAMRQQLEAAAGDVTYNDLYNETEALADELLQDYGDPVLNATADVLDEQELYDMDEHDWDGGPAWGGGRGGGVVLDTARAAAERGGQGSSSGAVATGSGKKGGKKAKGRAETEAAAGGKAAAISGGTAAAGPQGLSPLPPQTDANTVDLVGQIPELAVADLEDALDGAAEGAVLYVRHGVGTGAVREAVRALLDKRKGRGRGRVREWKELDASRGEVTVAWL